MAKGHAKISYQTPTAALPHEQAARHIAALGLQGTADYRRWCREQGFSAGLHKSWRLRRIERVRAARLAADSQGMSELRRHVADAGLDSVEEYAAWCARRGRRIALHRSADQLALERQALARANASCALADARRMRRKPEAFVHAVFDGSLALDVLRTDAERTLYNLATSLSSRHAVRGALLRLVLRLTCDVDVLTHRLAMPHLGLEQSNTLLTALYRVAVNHKRWIREPELWKSEFGSPRRRLGSLVHWLYASYPMPAVLDSAWFGPEGPETQQHLRWYLHVAGGGSLRSVDIPMDLTKRMIHCMLRAPTDVGITGALRWGQVRGMGGSQRLARAVAASRLGGIQQDEPFWATVVQFFVNNPMLDPERVAPIVDYLHDQRFVGREVRLPGGEWVRQNPPQAQLTMKGRSAAALVRQVDEWHRELARQKRPARDWRPAMFAGFEVQWNIGVPDGEAFERWTVTELLCTTELHQEGRYMNSCVATYASSCAAGVCSIWSIRRRGACDPDPVRIMTVEVTTRTRQIVQARGRFNCQPGSPSAQAELSDAREVLRRWAASAGLTLHPHAW